MKYVIGLIGCLFSAIGFLLVVGGFFVVCIAFSLLIVTGFVYCIGYFLSLARGTIAFTLLQSFYIACCLLLIRTVLLMLFGNGK